MSLRNENYLKDLGLVSIENIKKSIPEFCSNKREYLNEILKVLPCTMDNSVNPPCKYYDDKCLNFIISKYQKRKIVIKCTLYYSDWGSVETIINKDKIKLNLTCPTVELKVSKNNIDRIYEFLKLWYNDIVDIEDEKIILYLWNKKNLKYLFLSLKSLEILTNSEIHFSLNFIKNITNFSIINSDIIEDYPEESYKFIKNLSMRYPDVKSHNSANKFLSDAFLLLGKDYLNLISKYCEKYNIQIEKLTTRTIDINKEKYIRTYCNLKCINTDNTNYGCLELHLKRSV